MTRRYLVIYQGGFNHWSAYVPDVPGCGSVGPSLEELREKIHDELLLNLERMAREGRAVQDPIMGMDDVAPGVHAEWTLVKPMPARKSHSFIAKMNQRLRRILGPTWTFFSRSAKSI